MFIPKNEQGVFYLFSKYHEKLGFEKVINVQTGFPDITAIREGKPIDIELEFNLASFQSHYIFKSNTEKGPWMWDKKKLWRVFDYKKGDFVEVNEIILRPDQSAREKLFPDSTKVVISDPYNEYSVNWKGELVYKTLKEKCDCIVCWEKGGVKNEEGIEVIELKDMKLCN